LLGLALSLGDAPGILGGGFSVGALPLGTLGGRFSASRALLGKPDVEALKERELLCGEGAGVHLKDLALVWLGAVVDASPSDRELVWFDHLSSSVQLLTLHSTPGLNRSS